MRVANGIGVVICEWSGWLKPGPACLCLRCCIVAWAGKHLHYTGSAALITARNYLYKAAVKPAHTSKRGFHLE